jgi:hypothetical protein
MAEQMPAISSSAWKVVTLIVLQRREFVQDVGGRGDRIAAEEQRHAGKLRGGDEAERRGVVAGQAAVGAGADVGRAHPVAGEEHLGGVGVGIAGAQRQHVGLGDLGFLGELAADVLLLLLQRAAVEGEHQAQRVVVLAAADLLLGEARLLQGMGRQFGDVDLVDTEAAEAAVVERVDL